MILQGPANQSGMSRFQLPSHIDNLDIRKLSADDPAMTRVDDALREREQSILALFRSVVAADVRCRAAQDHGYTSQAAELNCHIAGVVSRRGVLLVARL